MNGLHHTPISQLGEIFGLTGSAVSRRVGVLKSKAAKGFPKWYAGRLIAP
jgi:hypothetical protein